ncbi:uncharacterized protein LOC110837741 [Zootermopsis nevadensis]|uniref:Uncharacterized protein n=1 Tax=Zootermopsis nevadensis TaxID=136037 RepID=A0A067QN19_ZOONE|nr:uncharacterized protein LOC110837741 [Zootermopsis nevadensis]KDR10705.1 hypothetical protein L798_15467 [Zootermopsis nevadensis]
MTSPTQGQTMEESELSQLEKENSILRAKLESMRKEASEYESLLEQANAVLIAMRAEEEKLKRRIREPKNVEACCTPDDEDSSTEEEEAVGEIDYDSIIIAVDKKCQEFLKEE